MSPSFIRYISFQILLHNFYYYPCVCDCTESWRMCMSWCVHMCVNISLTGWLMTGSTCLQFSSAWITSCHAWMFYVGSETLSSGYIMFAQQCFTTEPYPGPIFILSTKPVTKKKIYLWWSPIYRFCPLCVMLLLSFVSSDP